MNYSKLHHDVAFGQADGKIIWQPRIGCWYDDKVFNGGILPPPYTGMSLAEIYRDLNCSARIYDYNGCIKKEFDSRVKQYTIRHSELEIEHIIECPAGKISEIIKGNTSNKGTMKKKWLISTEEDMKVALWLEENCTWTWDQQHFDKTLEEWGELGAPTMYIERVNIQRLYIDMMGVEAGIYALYDYPDTVEAYFKALDESHARCIEVINHSPIDIINFGDNLHAGTLPPYLFEKYVLPAYQRRNELLHKAGKFTNAHWDGDTKPLLPYAKETGLDGIEAITPKPQGDVTIEEIKEALGDDIFLIDGIAAVLFDAHFTLSQLEEQTKKIIDLFGSKLILGISDEISSNGDIERIRFVGDIVNEYNNKL